MLRSSKCVEKCLSKNNRLVIEIRLLTNNLASWLIDENMKVGIFNGANRSQCNVEY